MTNLGSKLKSRDITLLTKVHLVKGLVFPVVMYGCESCKKSWVLKNWCFWTVVLEKTLQNPLGSKEIQSVHPKENQSWTFIGRTDAEAETPILWPLDSKSWLVRKDPDAGKDWMQEEKGMTEGEMVGWHHQLHGLEFEQALGVGDCQGSLAYCSLWDCKESDTTEQLNWATSMGDECNCPMVSTFFSTTLLGNQYEDWPSWITALSWWRSLCNSMKLWAMPCRANQDNGSEHRVLTKRDPLEEGMANCPNILSVRISWTIKKYKTLVICSYLCKNKNKCMLPYKKFKEKYILWIHNTVSSRHTWEICRVHVYVFF